MLTPLLLTKMFLSLGVEDWGPENAASESQDIWAVLRGWLLPGPVHLPEIRQASLCPLHVAGRSNRSRRYSAVSPRSLKLREAVAHTNPNQSIQKNWYPLLISRPLQYPKLCFVGSMDTELKLESDCEPAMSHRVKDYGAYSAEVKLCSLSNCP